MDPILNTLINAGGLGAMAAVLLYLHVSGNKRAAEKEDKLATALVDKEQKMATALAENNQKLLAAFAVQLQAERDSSERSQKEERDRNDRNLVRHWDELGKLRDAFELARCRYAGQCQYQHRQPGPPP